MTVSKMIIQDFPNTGLEFIVGGPKIIGIDHWSDTCQYIIYIDDQGENHSDIFHKIEKHFDIQLTVNEKCDCWVFGKILFYICDDSDFKDTTAHINRMKTFFKQNKRTKELIKYMKDSPELTINHQIYNFFIDDN